MLNQSLKKPIFLLFIANFFFAFQFVIRLSAGILREEIMSEFSVDASIFGALSGYYYLGYGLSQIPFGIMLDRYSYRLIVSSAIFITSLGAYLFISTNNWEILMFARFLSGFGSGIAFLSVAKIIKTYFEEKNHSILIGLSFSFGLFGAVCSTTPLVIAFQRYGYYDVLIILSIITFFIGLMTLFFGQIENNNKTEENKTKIFDSLKHLFLNYRMILIGVSGGLMVGALEGFADVWAIPMFNQVFNFSIVEGSMITMYIYFGMCFGGPILVFCSKAINSEYLMIILTAIFTIILFMILFLVDSFSMISLMVLMFLLGILCCYQVLVFSSITHEVDSNSSSLAISMVNCINMFFGYIFHSIIGELLVYSWQGEISDTGVTVYSKSSFIYSLSVIPMGCIVAIIGFLIVYLRKKI